LKITANTLTDHAPRIIAARPGRTWMDDFHDRHPYRCLPIATANTYGWEILCPLPLEVEWNGGPAIADLTVRATGNVPGGLPLNHFAESNFSRGIVTFLTGVIFETEAEWDLLVTGRFNDPKDGAYPLTGMVETNWLPYPFTMNWQLRRPGTFRFDEGEPLCIVFPVRKLEVADFRLEIRRLDDNPALLEKHLAFRRDRDEFRARLAAGDPTTVKEAWQRHYFVGRHPDGTRAEQHVNKLRLAEPVDLRKDVGATVPAAAVVGVPTRTDPRWGDRSHLTRIVPGQTRRNIAGRGRIDAEGRLRTWSDTRLVRSERDAAGLDFLVVDDLIPADQCALLIQQFDLLEEQGDPRRDRDATWSAVAEAERLAARLLTDFYRLKAPIRAAPSWPVRQRPGTFQLPLAGDTHHDFGGVLHLDDAYVGGELYFTALDVAVKPRTGRFVGFTTGFHHEHAILRVSGTTSCIMPSSYTFDHGGETKP
jgi:hypothetical protein